MFSRRKEGSPLALAPDVYRLEAYRAQTERLQLLIAFLATQVRCPVDPEGRCDDDVVSAYNIATATVLQHITAIVRGEHERG